MPPLLANTLLSMETFYSSVDPDLSRPWRLPPKLVAGIRAEVMPLRHSSPCSYFIPPFHLDDITLIITTIMYGFSGSIVALWLSAFSCIIVGTSNGLIAVSETSWAIIRHPPRFFFLSLSLAGEQYRLPLWRSFNSSGSQWEEETQNEFAI